MGAVAVVAGSVKRHNYGDQFVVQADITLSNADYNNTGTPATSGDSLDFRKLLGLEALDSAVIGLAVGATPQRLWALGTVNNVTGIALIRSFLSSTGAEDADNADLDGYTACCLFYGR